MEPKLLNFPHAFTSERLHIRCPLPGDGAEVNAAILETFEQLQLWVPWARKHPSIEESEQSVREAHAAFLLRSDLRLHIYLRETGELVALSGLHRINWSVPAFEIGYWCRLSQQGKGFVTEATQAIEDFAWKHLHANRLEIRVDPENHKSIRIPKKLGYTCEGTLRQNTRSPQGELRDTMIFSKLRELDFEASSNT